jgi:hypothetical protein
MAKYYYEGSEILIPFTVVSNEPMFDMTTVSLKTQRASQGHQRWELSFNTINPKENQVDSFLSSFKDLEDSNTMVMPQMTEVDKKVTVDATSRPIGANAAKGASSISIDANNNGLVPKGSFVKFNNDTKIYILTSDLNLSGTGNASVNIYPNLLKDLTTSNQIKFTTEAEITYLRSIDNQTGITFNDGVLSNIGTITLVEAL